MYKFICMHANTYPYTYTHTGLKIGDRPMLHRQMRITVGVIANHFGKVIR